MEGKTPTHTVHLRAQCVFLSTLRRSQDGWRASLLPAVGAGLGKIGPPLALSCSGSPDEDALVVMALPQAAIAFIGDGEDVRWKLAQVAPAVLLHGGALVQTSDGLVGVYRGDDGADVGL